MVDSTFANYRGKLRMAFVLSFLFLSISFSYSQNGLELALIEKSDLPNTATEHFYTFEVKNTTSSPQIIGLKAENISCNKDGFSNTSLNCEILDIKKQSLNKIDLLPGKSLNFLLRTERNAQTRLDSHSCIEVSVEAVSTGQASVNPATIIVKQFIPDPKSFE